MGSMHTGLEEAENGFERMAAYFAERARGGVGMIITGGISPNEEGGHGAKLATAEEADNLRCNNAFPAISSPAASGQSHVTEATSSHR